MELTECGEKDREGKMLISKMLNNRTNNPTFLLSGQLTGFDPIETRHRTRHYVHESHIYS